MTDDKIKELFPGAVSAAPQTEPDEKIIAALERLLQEAKAGAVQGFAYVAITPDDLRRSSWFGTSSGSTMIAELALLQHSLIRGYLDAIRN